MSKRKGLIIAVIAILLIGIGYATISATSLTIDGTASATADANNFQVYFTAENTVKSDETNVEVTVTAKATTATVNISNLSKKGDTAYAILEIKNGSNDIDAESVVVTTSGTDTTIIDIEVTMCDASGNAISDYSVASGSTTYVKVSAELLQTPLEDATATITATLTATPKANT